MRAILKYFSFLAIFIISVVTALAQVHSDQDIYTAVDKMPRLKGAGKNLSKYFIKEIDYPDICKLRGIEGDIWVSFIVTSKGEVDNVNVEKSVDHQLDSAVVAFVSQTKEWKPGEVDKKAVNTQMLVPLKFTLSESEKIFAKQLKTFNMLDKPPLFVLDNKIIEGYIEIESYNVKSIRVVKGQKAVELYGEKAKNGLVIMTSKRGTPPVY